MPTDKLPQTPRDPAEMQAILAKIAADDARFGCKYKPEPTEPAQVLVAPFWQTRMALRVWQDGRRTADPAAFYRSFVERYRTRLENMGVEQRIIDREVKNLEIFLAPAPPPPTSQCITA